ncbi:hypothetical protein [Rhizobium sp. BK456]|uniref:hypothetical protein n=1 Tax=Rhizobium sp. BK456 TaxID=2587007 RepID=UPI0016097C16|nr:hypothetical protein [Rhizobium sp. BK456]MBB3527064.1 hypothetical protein [Rhizobium sp. BK456]
MRYLFQFGWLLAQYEACELCGDDGTVEGCGEYKWSIPALKLLGRKYELAVEVDIENCRVNLLIVDKIQGCGHTGSRPDNRARLSQASAALRLPGEIRLRRSVCAFLRRTRWLNFAKPRSP